MWFRSWRSTWFTWWIIIKFYSFFHFSFYSLIQSQKPNSISFAWITVLYSLFFITLSLLTSLFPFSTSINSFITIFNHFILFSSFSDSPRFYRNTSFHQISLIFYKMPRTFKVVGLPSNNLAYCWRFYSYSIDLPIVYMWVRRIMIK